jgi:hypothetical protein
VIHPSTELVMVGPSDRGVRAAETLPRGTIVWIRDRFDTVLSPQQVGDLPAPYRGVVQRWGYRDAAGSWILCADHARFVNHACAPNLRSLGEDVQIAVRDIAAGDEITCDYAECNVSMPSCRCGHPDCRGAISPRDLETHAAVWDREICAALEGAARLPQPLLPFIREPLLVDAWLSNLVPPPGVVALALRSAG